MELASRPFRFSVLAGIVAVAGAVVVMVHPGPLPGELSVVTWLQARPEPVGSVASFARTVNGTEGTLIVGAPVAVWLLARRHRGAVGAIAIALIALLVVQPVFKEIVDRPRPSADVVEVRAEHVSTSYPSGHSLSTTTLWGAAAGYAWLRRRQAIALLLAVPIVANLVASSVMGVHWPSDAIAGTLVGGIAAHLILRQLQPTVSDDSGR